ncbi:hypothetical protein E2C01_078517 [Portunus trituberculatus]|uniref:Uncharacterized protein n=1 Tax=Portunus trituberculatus TaxID=210409 RepID=A0A5B7IH49_PORTR|nr:hypothetical protein [Portunus trituberculatus]
MTPHFYGNIRVCEISRMAVVYCKIRAELASPCIEISQHPVQPSVMHKNALSSFLVPSRYSSSSSSSSSSPISTAT